MTAPPPPDPSALLREMLGQWERIANEWGGRAMKSDDFVRAMHGAAGPAMEAREAMLGGWARALAAANMPTKEDVQALGAQVAAVEDRLVAIEALLVGLAGTAPAVAVPRPRRTKLPASRS